MARKTERKERSFPFQLRRKDMNSVIDSYRKILPNYMKPERNFNKYIVPVLFVIFILHNILTVMQVFN